MVDDDTDGELARFCADAHPRLVAALTYQLGDRLLAQELAQEALIRACDRWPHVRRLESPMGWTFRVGVNLGRSWLRRRAAERRARVRHGVEAVVHEDADGADRVALGRALQALTDAQRQVVVLRFYLGHTPAEVAAVTGSTPGAVRVATHRAVARLRDHLGVSLPSAQEDADV
jgi:RNA polymerase sigma factor (sigma-70 family)